jgi:hypothetical protein
VAFLVNGGVVSRIYPRYNFSIDEEGTVISMRITWTTSVWFVRRLRKEIKHYVM